jgi:hypothetical protein
MGIRRFIPRSIVGRIVAAVVVLPLILCAVLYFCLLSAEYYSARQASRMLYKLEAIRLGDSLARFEEAVRGCSIERRDGEHSCILTAGAFRWQAPVVLMSKLPLDQNYALSRILDRAGLRYWRLSATAFVQDGRIQHVSAQLLVVGSYETLGARWRIAQQVPSEYLNRDPSMDDRRTLIHWFHITSLPAGQGLMIDATPDSTEKELRARRINRSCLFSTRGCDGLCEILPDMAPVLKERNRNWGGRTDAPKSKCESN